MKALFVQTLVLFSGVTVFCACQGRGPAPTGAASVAVPSAPGGDLRVAVQDNVPLYRSGPQQLTGPDAHLEKGTLVRVVQKQFGYSLVETADGDRSGWVASEALGVAPPETWVPRAMPVDNGASPPLESVSPPLGSASPPVETGPPAIEGEKTNENPAVPSPSKAQDQNDTSGEVPSSVAPPVKSPSPSIAP